MSVGGGGVKIAGQAHHLAPRLPRDLRRDPLRDRARQLERGRAELPGRPGGRAGGGAGRRQPSRHRATHLRLHRHFSGAYRDIPLAAGVRARNVAVSEAGEEYEPGGATGLGSYDRPGTFGAEQLEITEPDGGPTKGFRVVWHYEADSEERRFQVELRHHRRGRGLRRCGLRAVGGVGEPVGVRAR